MSFNLQGLPFPEIRNPSPSPILPCRYLLLPKCLQIRLRRFDPSGNSEFRTVLPPLEPQTLLAFLLSEVFPSTTVAASFLADSSYELPVFITHRSEYWTRPPEVLTATELVSP